MGPIGAATIIEYTKSITGFPTKGHYATYNATAPIEVSSASQHKTSPEPAREPHPQSCHPHCSCHPATTQTAVPISTGSSQRARPRTKRSGHRNDASQTPSTELSSPTQEASQETEKRVRPGGQPGMPREPRGQLTILKSWLFGQVTPGPDTNLHPKAEPGSAPIKAPPETLLTQRGFVVCGRSDRIVAFVACAAGRSSNHRTGGRSRSTFLKEWVWRKIQAWAERFSRFLICRHERHLHCTRVMLLRPRSSLCGHLRGRRMF